MSCPIDVYYQRLQKCQKISEDAGYPITANDLILQLQTTMGASGMVNEEYKAWKKKAVAEKTWTNAKKHFRDALDEMEGIQKLTTAGGGLMTKSAKLQTM